MRGRLVCTNGGGGRAVGGLGGVGTLMRLVAVGGVLGVTLEQWHAEAGVGDGVKVGLIAPSCRDP
jgi:hypothetical protein